MTKFCNARRFGASLALGAATTLITVGTAAAEDVEFTATIPGSCTITVLKPGTLEIGADYQTLTSAGATSGRVKVRSTAAGYKVTVEDPATWDIQPGTNDDTGADFEASYTVDGATAKLAGETTDLPAGTEIKSDIDLTVTQTNDYGAGNYKATVVVTCE